MSDSTSNDIVVLVIEDDLPHQELLSDVLTEEGYRVVTARLGGQGLLRIGVAQPELVTLDLRLPDIDGEHVLELLRQYPDTRTLPVVIISGAQPIPAQIHDLADAVVPKPFDRDALVTIIRGLVGPPQAGESAAS